MSRTVSRVMYQMIIYLDLTLPPDSSDLPESKDGQSTFLFGLASDGVYRAMSVTSHAVVSYTAFPPLPAKAGGLFLLHFPGSHLHRTLSGILPCEARTFLTCCLSAIAAAIICATQSFLVCIFFYHTEYINTELGFFAKSYKTAAVLRAVFVL